MRIGESLSPLATNTIFKYFRGAEKSPFAPLKLPAKINFYIPFKPYLTPRHFFEGFEDNFEEDEKYGRILRILYE